MVYRGESKVIKGAHLSEDGVYRYTLWREWELTQPSDPAMFFIMLNPSTADETDDDPTLRRCIGFAQREGFKGVQLFNLFAFRARFPHYVRQADDPVGPENDQWLEIPLRLGHGESKVVCAWGANPMAIPRAEYVKQRATELGTPLYHLGLTEYTKVPRHPLYLKSDTPLELWNYDD